MKENSLNKKRWILIILLLIGILLVQLMIYLNSYKNSISLYKKQPVDLSIAAVGRYTLSQIYQLDHSEEFMAIKKHSLYETYDSESHERGVGRVEYSFFYGDNELNNKNDIVKYIGKNYQKYEYKLCLGYPIILEAYAYIDKEHNYVAVYTCYGQDCKNDNAKAGDIYDVSFWQMDETSDILSNRLF